MKDKNILRNSKFFVMRKNVCRHQRGRGARFQNHKITSYEITSAMSLWSSAWSPSDAEVTALINAEYSDDFGNRRTWKFNNRKAADQVWVLLLMKYGE